MRYAYGYTRHMCTPVFFPNASRVLQYASRVIRSHALFCFLCHIRMTLACTQMVGNPSGTYISHRPCTYIFPVALAHIYFSSFLHIYIFHRSNKVKTVTGVVLVCYVITHKVNLEYV